MVGRPKSFDEDTAIDAFVNVFWTRGFDATSIDDLQASVGIKRGSFYAAFGNKETAFVTALERYAQTVTRSTVSALDDADSPIGGLSGFIRRVGAFMAANPGRGCLLLTSLVDRPPLSDDQAGRLESIGATIQQKIMKTANSAARDFNPKNGHDAETVSAFVMSSLLGLNAMARAGYSGDAILAAADTAAGSVEAA